MMHVMEANIDASITTIPCSHIHKSPIAHVPTSLFSSSYVPHDCSHAPTFPQLVLMFPY